jgi:hypothetical protein
MAGALGQRAEWVADREGPEFPTVLQIFAEQPSAASLDGRRDDQSIWNDSA